MVNTPNLFWTFVLSCSPSTSLCMNTTTFGSLRGNGPVLVPTPPTATKPLAWDTMTKQPSSTIGPAFPCPTQSGSPAFRGQPNFETYKLGYPRHDRTGLNGRRRDNELNESIHTFDIYCSPPPLSISRAMRCKRQALPRYAHCP
ncbi:hypothetical protein B0T18DRAFT_187752 [Schizothecium vesticola]|uniref:Secreted protein n=1 Tax=Schizothecium vesticola TaxID=314040 RepID=A0AA40K2L1_9PEZI|nr:hypothetical protein B0T18DRAFT_187752 [Schizothecium vesticola]